MSKEILDEADHLIPELRTTLIILLEYMIGLTFLIEMIAVIYILREEFRADHFSTSGLLLFLSIVVLMLFIPVLYIYSWRKKTLDFNSKIGIINPLWLFLAAVSGGINIFFGSLIVFYSTYKNTNPQYPLTILFSLLLIMFGILFLIYVWKTTHLAEQWNTSKKEHSNF